MSQSTDGWKKDISNKALSPPAQVWNVNLQRGR
jgi:hypothetical protein